MVAAAGMLVQGNHSLDAKTEAAERPKLSHGGGEAVNRECGTECANRRWLQRLVRPLVEQQTDWCLVAGCFFISMGVSTIITSTILALTK
jgi:hypothetical protein